MMRQGSDSPSSSQGSYTESSSSLASSSSSFRSALSTPDQSYEPYDQSIFECSDEEEPKKEDTMRGTNISMQRYELIPPPAVPARSSRRSQIILLKQTDDIERPLSRQAIKHERYLSSEEDASSSADESDFDFDSESEGSVGSSTWRRSQEITARAVSVIYSGKPVIVQLPSRPRSTSPHSIPAPPVNSRLRRIPAAASLTADRNSITAANPSLYSPKHEKRRPSFLSIDPFTTNEASESNETSRPKTPTALLKRTFAFTKKNKQSVDLTSSQESLSFARRRSEASVAHFPPAAAAAPPTEPLPPTPVSYQDIMRAARRNARTQTSPPSSQTPTSPSTGKGIMNNLSLGRRKSFKAL